MGAPTPCNYSMSKNVFTYSLRLTRGHLNFYIALKAHRSFDFGSRRNSLKKVEPQIGVCCLKSPF